MLTDNRTPAVERERWSLGTSLPARCTTQVSSADSPTTSHIVFACDGFVGASGHYSSNLDDDPHTRSNRSWSDHNYDDINDASDDKDSSKENPP